MKALVIALAAGIWGISAFLPSVYGQALTVTSSTDGQGLYTYTFSKGSQPYVWGLSTNTAIYLQSYGVLGTSQPTNWIASFDESGRIVWSATNGIVFIEDPVIVSVRSIFKTSRAYKSWDDEPPVFRKGFALGTIYGITNHEPLSLAIEDFESIGPDPTTLSIRQNNNNSVVISWYSALTNGQLEATKNLSDSNSWTPVTNKPVISGDHLFVTNSASPSPRFYRLKF